VPTGSQISSLCPFPFRSRPWGWGWQDSEGWAIWVISQQPAPRRVRWQGPLLSLLCTVMQCWLTSKYSNSAPDESADFLKSRVLHSMEIFSVDHGCHPQEHETLVGLCFPTGGSQTLLRIQGGWCGNDASELRTHLCFSVPGILSQVKL
jgi:hypothetical protein